MRTVNIKIALTLDIPEDADHDEIDDLLNELNYEFFSDECVVVKTEIIENQCE